MGSFSRNTPTEKGGIIGYEYSGRNVDERLIRPAEFEECPYNSCLINTNLFVTHMNTTIQCPECGNDIVVEPQWICDPECESDGTWVFWLHTVEEAIEANIEID